MNVGVSEIDISPPVGTDLSGFAARIQPSNGVLDPLHAKCLYIDDMRERLLWLHADLLGLDHAFVRDFRDWARRELRLMPHQVFVSATHTHAGPATICLTGCGTCDDQYMTWLAAQCRLTAQAAMEGTEPAELVVAQVHLDLAIDRRKQPSAHTDPHVGAAAFRGTDGSFIAVVANYPMHPVALGHVNRKISADWCGYAAGAIAAALPGEPVVLMTNGACGNLNPPVQPLSPPEVQSLGQQVADAVASPLRTSATISGAQLHLAQQAVAMPLETLTPQQIDEAFERAPNRDVLGEAWVRGYHEALDTWRRCMKQIVARGEGGSADIELFAVALGPIHFMGVTGEIFSRFTTDLRAATGRMIRTVGYANGAYGYIPTAAAYAEGGYETDVAHFFYNSFRPKIGGLELLLERATRLIESITSV